MQTTCGGADAPCAAGQVWVPNDSARVEGTGLESVQKLSEEPRKEYAGVVLLFSYRSCIRAI